MNRFILTIIKAIWSINSYSTQIAAFEINLPIFAFSRWTFRTTEQAPCLYVGLSKASALIKLVAIIFFQVPLHIYQLSLRLCNRIYIASWKPKRIFSHWSIESERFQRDTEIKFILSHFLDNSPHLGFHYHFHPIVHLSDLGFTFSQRRLISLSYFFCFYFLASSPAFHISLWLLRQSSHHPYIIS